MTIRLGVDDDAERLTDLHLAVWEEAYAGLMPAEIFAQRRATRSARIERWREILGTEGRPWVVERDGRLIGFASTSTGRDDDPDLPPLELMALYVRAEVYGTGTGHALLQAAIGTQPAYLWVLDGNDRAIRLYERQGFTFDGAAKAEPVGLERRMRRP